MTVENRVLTTISFGPCWCNGDTTTGGHYHGSATGGNIPKAAIYGDDSLHSERKAILDVLIEIRDLLVDARERTSP